MQTLLSHLTDKRCVPGAPIPQRWLFGLMGLLAQANAYMMRICLSLAITQMVVGTDSSEYSDDTCPSSNSTSTTNSETGIYEWDESLQGIILSAFYWGYVISHIPGGLLAERYGGKYVLGLGILSTSLCTLITPLVVEWGGSTALITLRFIIGLGEGTVNPAQTIMLSQWAPSAERSKIGTFVYAGNQIGTILANSLSGLLLQYSPIGWRSVFYFFGSIGTLWFIVFTLVCYSSPDQHPFVSDKEKEYVKSGTSEHAGGKAHPTPWRFILTSLPLWSLVIAQIGHDWGLFTMITDLPLYMNNVLHFSIQSNGLLTAIPYIVMWIVSMASSWLADWLINTGKMSRTNVRKFLTTVGSMGPAVFIVAASYAGCDRTLVVVFFVMGMGLMGAYYPGMKVNMLDLSPNYSGTVMGIVSGLGALSGIVTPYLVGVLTPDQTLYQWRLVFWIVFAVFAITNLIYLLFASGDVQPWNDPEFLARKKQEREGTDKVQHSAAETTRSVDRA